jgi:hypothetical protein
MLDALEKGVKGGRWYSLIDKVYAEETLWAGWRQVKRNGSSAGMDGQTVAQFERGAGKRIRGLYELLRAEAYEPQPVRRVLIPKDGSREFRLKNAIRNRTRRYNGQSLERIIETLNAVLRGWFAYFKHSDSYTFKLIDGWVRRRLRTILRTRQRRRGLARGADHQRCSSSLIETHQPESRMRRDRTSGSEGGLSLPL